MISISRRTSKITVLTAGLCCLCGALFPSTTQAQLIIRRRASGIDSGPGTKIAVLQTDPELESILEKAKRFQDDGNFRVATKLMQAVLERSGNSLFSNDDQTYFSLVRQVEQQLAAMPPEGLAAYRLEADAEALALVAAGERGDLAGALKQVVDKFFISSLGDDAAFRLGRLYLDQYDFISAQRVLEKALTHPDLSVQKSELLSHIAVCDLFLNDLKAAQEKSQQVTKDAPDLRIARLVADEVENIESGGDSLSSVRQSPTTAWKMPLASEHRYGVGLPVNERMLGGDLVASFQYIYDLAQPASRAGGGEILAGSSASGIVAKKSQTDNEKRMLSKRTQHGWRPTGMLLFGPDEVYLKTGQDMLALKKSKLPMQTKARGPLALVDDDPAISWRSLWKNLFEVDKGTSYRAAIGGRFGRVVLPNRRGVSTPIKNTTPTSVSEVQVFGDDIAAQFSMHNGVLYSIEGKVIGDRARTVIRQRITYGQNVTRVRTNRLVAYDANEEGKVLWSLPKEPVEVIQANDVPLEDVDVEPSRFLEQGGFMGAPVGFKNSIIVPVNLNASIWLYAFDPNDSGATLWKTHLCDQPSTGANPWSAINVSVDGSNVLVSGGLGVVFVLDAATGQIRIARRYERGGKLDEVTGSSRWPGAKKTDFTIGWSSDTIVPYGRQMICFCSDAKEIESIDRESGKTLWTSDFKLVSQKLDYLLGVYDGVLYAAGPKTIVAIDLATGQHTWGGDDLFDEKVSLGKGVLTPQGIFVPVEDKILQFNLTPEKLTTTPDPVRSIAVDLGGAEVGNLFSDGERFWVHGGNRIYALEAKPE